MERGGAALVVETDAPVSFSVACVGGASKSASTELTAWLSFLGEHDKHLPLGAVRAADGRLSKVS